MSRKIPRYKGHSEFRLSESQSARLREWILETETKVATNQVKTGKGVAGNELDPREIGRIHESIERGEPLPNYGPISGAYKYSFLPTSLGMVIKVENVVSGDIIDLSDYEDW